ncbi:MAG: nuclear transport factor 2 family protein [Actinobacteria bacterium]|nr:nuclear transport factor 2 family protein [Actinomycetota bacterium]
MRFRLAEWDIAMPEPLVAYWAAWNAENLERVSDYLSVAVTEDVEWNDPRDSFVGKAALKEAIRALRSTKPSYRFIIASEIDHQHGRLRYRWDMINRGRTLMEGLDVATVDAATGLICRVDGFFGNPTPLKAAQSGVPRDLYASSRTS